MPKFEVHIMPFDSSPEVQSVVEAENPDEAARQALTEDWERLVGEPANEGIIQRAVDSMHHNRGEWCIEYYGSIEMRIRPIPEVGMGATYSIGSDSYPYTITRVGPSGKVMWVRRDNYRRTDKNGLSEVQSYEYMPNPEAPEERVVWTSRGWKMVNNSGSISIGVRRKYADPHF